MKPIKVHISLLFVIGIIGVSIFLVKLYQTNYEERSEYVAGKIQVNFNDDLKYNQAKTLLEGYGLQIPDKKTSIASLSRFFQSRVIILTSEQLSFEEIKNNLSKMPQVVSVEPENKRATSLRVSNRVLVQFAFDTTKTEAQQILKTANVNAEENSFLRYDEVDYCPPYLDRQI